MSPLRRIRLLCYPFNSAQVPKIALWHIGLSKASHHFLMYVVFMKLI
ncbi:hypothetical protein MTR67_003425 [Solanum verrucosum]|uniref:Uncharacterized protein n=1 Tax=Solanum verrucosum TaxID=315347 RepID=A0AAF0PUA2_SOLVR|nr:hypothetical protein MTR67_003425 [Solanum verrucosum]